MPHVRGCFKYEIYKKILKCTVNDFSSTTSVKNIFDEGCMLTKFLIINFNKNSW